MALTKCVLVAGVALGSIIGTACSGDDDAGDGTTTPTTEVVNDSTTTTEDPTTAEFAVPFSIVLPDGWSNTVLADIRDVYYLVSPAADDPNTTVEIVIPKAETPDDALADIVELAGSNYVLSDPVETTVGNMPATYMDVELAEGGMGQGAVLYDIRGSITTGTLYEDTSGRIYVVDVNGKPVIVLVQAPTADLDAFLDDAEGMLDSAEF